jgi:hypothetical protein
VGVAITGNTMRDRLAKMSAGKEAGRYGHGGSGDDEAAKRAASLAAERRARAAIRKKKAANPKQQSFKFKENIEKFSKTYEGSMGAKRLARKRVGVSKAMTRGEEPSQPFKQVLKKTLRKGEMRFARGKKRDSGMEEGCYPNGKKKKKMKEDTFDNTGPENVNRKDAKGMGKGDEKRDSDPALKIVAKLKTLATTAAQKKTTPAKPEQGKPGTSK